MTSTSCTRFPDDISEDEIPKYTPEIRRKLKSKTVKLEFALSHFGVHRVRNLI
jgi:hypothetical protein